MSDDKSQPSATKSNDKVDDELSELLDSALEDFKHTPEEVSTGSEGAMTTKNVPEEEKSVEDWSNDFIREAASQFEQNLGGLFGKNEDGSEVSEEQIQLKFQQMAEAAQQVFTNPTVTESSQDIASAISQTIQGLNEGTENLQSPISEQDIMGLFGGGGQGDPNAFLPFMQGMMQSLLSKEVLYPSLKDILDKFPDWLEQNKSKISPEDSERYSKQMSLMQEVCTELDKEQDNESADVKKERFEKVLALMQKLQDYGQPPSELVGDVGPPMPLDFGAAQQNPAEQCNVM